MLEFERGLGRFTSDSCPLSLIVSPRNENVEAQEVLCLLGAPLRRKLKVRAGGRGSGGEGRETKPQIIPNFPPLPSSGMTCQHDREIGHCGGPEAHLGRPGWLFVEVTTGEIWVCLVGGGAVPAH